jgi:uncharacterized protein (DUF58 family)
MSTHGAAKWRLAAQAAAALAYLLLYAGNRVGLLAFSGDLDVVSLPARGRSACARLLTRLAETTARSEGGASRLDVCARFATRGASVVVVSDFLAPDFLGSGLAQLLRRGSRVQALQIVSPLEVSLAAAEYAILRDVESGDRRHVRLTGPARAHAAASLTVLGDQLQTYCRTHGIALTQCDTDATWREVVLAHLRSLEPFRA